ncbi:MAG: HEPN domain-containing protein [Lachnospiraceae bacterium]|jgi:uncharacterized protein (UPF0332 family)|nr:HEPN domain-containing protein [Lachnospiraceae bacterium]
MDKYSIYDLSRFRIEQARECLQSAETLMSINHHKDAANRSYYCIFHLMRAVLALDSFDSKKHSGIISEFQKRYIKTEKFSVKFSDTIKDAFDIRNDSDYQDFYTISKADVQLQIENAKEFLEAVKVYVTTFAKEQK